MSRRPLRPHFFGLIMLLALMGLASCKKTGQEGPIRVAAAANLQFVLPVLDSIFEADTGLEVDITYGASGVMAAQIRQGAPFDLFLAANESYPSYLWENGHARAAPRVYASGSLVWWWKGPRSLEEQLERSRNIAIANPKTAPYGVEAEQFLRRGGLWDGLEDRIVYGENIGQVNQFLLTGAAGLGLTSKSVIGSDQMSKSGRWQAVDTSQYAPVRQALVLTREAKPSAVRFRDFILSREVRHVWETYGYNIP